MTNREVARKFNMLGKVMELHGENPFKIRSYSSAYNTIRRLPQEVANLSKEELLDIQGIGKNIADKIAELNETGEIATLQRYLDQTPAGIVQMLSIKGLGAKKILLIWKDLGIESAGELLYACEENRLVDLKGFGEKTQENLRKQLVYFLDAQGKYLYGHVIEEARELLGLIEETYVDARFDFINDIKRQMQIVHSIDILGTHDEEEVMAWLSELDGVEEEQGGFRFRGTTVHYVYTDEDEFYHNLFMGSGSEAFLDAWSQAYGDDFISEDDESLFDMHGCGYIPPESRELSKSLDDAQIGSLEIVDLDDIRGVVHCHSTYSDGANTLKQMADASKAAGYEYLVITDHSKSAFYADGLKEPEVLRQMAEVDELNKSYDEFKIFKGIESDILSDGRLDYDEDILSKFEVIIASVHSNLKMDIVKATDRIIRAVMNPYTRILGHPTGRLLLSREGYPLDHKAVIDACAAHDVVIELNANPYRLDMDWTWIPYAVEKGVMISINPDAHNINGISDIQYGVSAARKALLRPAECLNTLTLGDFSDWVERK